MLFAEESGDRGPLVVMLHWLGGSSRSWHEVSSELASLGLRGVAVDLPGFGQSRHVQEFSIPQMVRATVETIRHLRGDAADSPWILAGHSMGGKLAMLIAHAAEQGEPGLMNLRGLVLLSPSPPGPEPMAEDKRAKTLRTLGPETNDPTQRRKHAEEFVDANTGKLPLVESVRDRSVEDVLRMNPEALAAWMTTGSRLDCSTQVGKLSLPALIMAGTEEPALGPESQAQHTLPHLAAATLIPLQGGGHLAPLERPHEVADRMIEFFHSLDLPLESKPASLSQEFAALIDSSLTAPQTRDVLLKRLSEQESSSAGALTPDELRTLRALAACVVPGAPFDLASRMDRALSQSRHDGWRFDALPDDATAWKLGLASLDAAAMREHGVPLIALDTTRQNDLLQRAQSGDLGRGWLALVGLGDSTHILNAAQMRDWFEDVRSELAKLYIADPRTMERIGFTGFADEAGFTHITLSDQESDRQEVHP
jgi:pimeloyl-ACP methyl ester carboxylesterase